MRHGLPTAAFVALGLILSTPVWAVSVGDIRPQSRVGEALVVSIAIVDSDGIADDSIQIAPASAADHALLGMQRPAWLDQMLFRSERDANGQLQVRGSAPVLPTSSEQNFLVQLSWPGHVRLQQVNVSLPAANSPTPAANAVADSASTSATNVNLPEPVGSSADAATATVTPAPAAITVQADSTVIPAQPEQRAAVIPAPIVERPAQTRSGPISIRRGDTLSQIASEWDQDLSLNQRQQIIRERNPNAFINGNINRLRADVRIDLPDPSTIAVPSERAADRWYSQALRQAQGLIASDLKKPVVATATTETKNATSEPNLTLLAPGQGDDAAGAADSAGNGRDAISSALTDAETERASLLAKRLQLRERLAALEVSNTGADQRLQVLDERLAAMEAGEAIEPEGNVNSSTVPDNGWMWWLAAGLFWLLLLVVWLRQRAQRHQADLDSERKEPVMAASADTADVELEVKAPEAVTEFDDTFAHLAPSATTLGDYADASAADAGEDAAAEEYDFLSDSDAEAYQTRLDLAQAYLDMNEDDAARQLLDRVMEGGTTEQRARAKALIDTLS